MGYVTIDQVTKGYENQVVLDDISLTLKKGNLLPFLGKVDAEKVHCYVPLRGLKVLI